MEDIFSALNTDHPVYEHNIFHHNAIFFYHLVFKQPFQAISPLKYVLIDENLIG
ncbi:hypothetical protein J2X77_002193 [Sphingobacterium sp. 2149]|nr:hypothetical protein [Sphingobacterium sp. 2149]